MEQDADTGTEPAQAGQQGAVTTQSSDCATLVGEPNKSPELLATIANVLELTLPLVITVAIMWVGFRTLYQILMQERPEAGSPSRIASALTEKNDPDEPISVSRVAVAIGSVAFVGVFSGLGVWSLIKITQNVCVVGIGLDNLVNYLLFGVAMFFPYAFNQIATALGKPTAPSRDMVMVRMRKEDLQAMSGEASGADTPKKS